MEVRDPVHGSIKILDEEKAIIEHPFFQRLRSIKQLGFSEFVFPGATHTRYLHSIGVMDIATKVFNQLFKDKRTNPDILRLKETVRLACLLHDIGHAPLSHTTEFVMPSVGSLELAKRFADNPDLQATHEDYTTKTIVDSSFTAAFSEVEKNFGVNPNNIAELIIGHTSEPEYFTYKGVNYFPLLHQLVSSEMDCDRMDYLLRDSYFCGVSYGKFDLDWIIDNMKTTVIDGEAYLGISERAVATFDDFLLCRFHMFLMVYFHYKSVCLEEMLRRYFTYSNNEYSIPANIEEYLKHNDHLLMKTLSNSQNEWAQKIVLNQIPKKIFEKFGPSQNEQLINLEQFLSSENIDYIKCSSSGRLSKYYTHGDQNDNKFSLKVVRDSSISSSHFFIQDIHEATDLFEKFSKAHTVDRIHCEYEKLAEKHKTEILKIVQS